MRKILVPIDGSGNSARVVHEVLRLATALREPLEVHLVNVQPPFPGTITGVAAEARQYHEEQSGLAFAGACKALEGAGAKYTKHALVGDPARIVAQLVDELKCDQVIMGTRGMGVIANMLMGSVAAKVLHLVSVPVTLVK